MAFGDRIKEVHEESVGQTAARPFRWLSSLFGWIVKIILFLVSLALVALVIIWLIGAFRSGTASYLGEHILVGAEEGGFFGSIKFLILGAFHPERLVTKSGFDATVDKNQDNENLGVLIKQFKSTREFYYSQDPIDAFATLQAGTLKDETELTLWCELEDYEGPIEIRVDGGRTEESKGYRTILKNDPGTFGVRCKFLNGIPTDKKVDASRARLFVEYPFLTQSYTTFYFLSEAEFRKLEPGQNPFTVFKISDPDIKSNNQVTSHYSYGPIKMGITTAQSQPFRENNEYFFTLRIQNIGLGNLKEGTLTRVNELKLYVPPEIKLDDSSSNCDFEKSKTDQEFDVYVLRQELLSVFDTDCFNMTSFLEREKCLDQREDITYVCNFNINSLDEGGLFYGRIRSEIDYVYRIDKSTLIDIRNTAL